MTEKKQIKPWKVLESTEVFKTRASRFRQDRCELPDGKVMPRYSVMELPPWVNVVALTPDHKLILVEQYRHAVEAVTLELPGGRVEHHDQLPAWSEDINWIQNSALRELEEETGYRGSRVILAGSQWPNPAFQNNKMYTFVAFDCELVSPQKLDEFEDIAVILKPIAETLAMVRAGTLSHSLMIASLFAALPHLPVEL